jgi:hypothetical protein
MPSFSVYTDRIVAKAPPSAGQLVFTKRDKLESLARERGNVRIDPVFIEGGIVLALVDSADVE